MLHHTSVAIRVFFGVVSIGGEFVGPVFSTPRSGWSKTRDASKLTWNSSWGSWRSPWRHWILAQHELLLDFYPKFPTRKWLNDVHNVSWQSTHVPCASFFYSHCCGCILRTSMLVGTPRRPVSPNNGAAPAAHDTENDGNGLRSPQIASSDDDAAVSASFEAGNVKRVSLGS